MPELARVGLDELSARRLTDRIRTVLTTVQEQLEELLRLVEEGRTGDVHVALGYRSWTEYAEKEFGDLRLRWPRQDRQELVERLTGLGMSTRAIAPIAGVSKDTVYRDVAGVSNETPVQQTAEGGPGVSDDTGDGPTETGEWPPSPAVGNPTPGERTGRWEMESVETSASPANRRSVTGRDGKEYRVSPRPVRVRSEQRTNVVAVMGRVVSRAIDAAEAAEAIKREHLRSRKEEAARWARDLNNAIQSLQRLAELLEENS